MYTFGGDIMTIAKTRDVRDKFKSYCYQTASGEIFVIPRPKNQNVVMISESAYNELLQLAEKQRRADYIAMLQKSMAEAEAGGLVLTSIEELEGYEE